jgi:hypothetical protein
MSLRLKEAAKCARMSKTRVTVLVAGLITCLILFVVSFDRNPPLHHFQVASDIERVLIQTECSLNPLSISNLPFKQAIVSEATLQAPAERQVSGCRPRTPLFIGFSENEPLLAQAVLSYIACGWPGSDIIIVDNTGTFDFDTNNESSLDYDQFRRQYGVNVLQTPAQLSFSQLQNFYIYTARLQGWQYFFWTHMDIVVLSYQHPSPSLYQRVISSLNNITDEGSSSRWAFGWYHYDYLSLVNVLAANLIGQWDVDIPYYPSDCDYYTRSRQRGFQILDFRVGHLIDVGSTLSDTRQQLFNGSYNDVYNELLQLEKRKKNHRAGQSLWSPMRKITIKAGRQVYKKKWGTDRCNP